MQHLLDFVQEHSVEPALTVSASTATGELEVMWQRGGGEQHWRIRPKRCQGPWQLVPRAELLDHLQQRGVDMLGFERELHALIATQIVFANIVLRDAVQLLGRDAVQSALQAHRDFVTLLITSVRQVAEASRPSVQVIPGDAAAPTPARSGHLTLIR